MRPLLFHFLMGAALLGPAAYGQNLDNSNLVVVARRDIDIDSLSKDQVTRIYLKQISTLPNGKPVEPLDLAEGSPVYQDFYAKVIGKTPVQIRSYWSRQAFTGMAIAPKQYASAAEVRQALANVPGTLAYLARKDVNDQLKVLFDPNK